MSVVLRTLTHISISILWSKHHTCTCKQQKRFIMHNSFYYYVLLNQYILNISSLCNPGVNLSLASQKIWDHMFSDPKSDHKFLNFWFRTWIIFCFFSHVAIVYLLQIQKGVGIYCKLIPNWIRLEQARILFPAQYRSVIQNKTRDNNWISIPKIEYNNQ